MSTTSALQPASSAVKFPLPAWQIGTLEDMAQSNLGLLDNVDPSVLASIDYAESKGNPGPANSAGYGGYFGLSQQDLANAQQTGTLGVNSTVEFEAEAQAAAKDFAALQSQFGSNYAAEAAYQVGPGNVDAQGQVFRQSTGAGWQLLSQNEGVSVMQQFSVPDAPVGPYPTLEYSLTASDAARLPGGSAQNTNFGASGQAAAAAGASTGAGAALAGAGGTQSSSGFLGLLQGLHSWMNPTNPGAILSGTAGNQVGTALQGFGGIPGFLGNLLKLGNTSGALSALTLPAKALIEVTYIGQIVLVRGIVALPGVLGLVFSLGLGLVGAAGSEQARSIATVVPAGDVARSAALEAA